MRTPRQAGSRGRPHLLSVMNLITILMPGLLAGWGLAELAAVDGTLAGQHDPTSWPVDTGPPVVLKVSSVGVAVDGVEGRVDTQTNLRCAGDVCAKPGDYPLDALTQALATVKDARPANDRVTIVTDGDVPYGVLVAVMNAAREVPAGHGCAPRLLFPRAVVATAAP